MVDKNQKVKHQNRLFINSHFQSHRAIFGLDIFAFLFLWPQTESQPTNSVTRFVWLTLALKSTSLFSLIKVLVLFAFSYYLFSTMTEYQNTQFGHMVIYNKNNLDSILRVPMGTSLGDSRHMTPYQWRFCIIPSLLFDSSLLLLRYFFLASSSWIKSDSPSDSSSSGIIPLLNLFDPSRVS